MKKVIRLKSKDLRAIVASGNKLTGDNDADGVLPVKTPDPQSTPPSFIFHQNTVAFADRTIR